MEVGLFLDLRNPPGWRTDNTRLYGFTLELIEEAERLGAHSIWVTEHHLFDDGYLPQPLTFLAAAAARTKRIRLGTAILLSALRPAPQIAEEAAIVDIISGGRLELGLGAGYRPPEFDLFDAEFAARFRTNDARARELRRIWTDGAVTPRPVQARLPLWMGYQTEMGARRAGRLGERLLCPNAALWPAYRQGLVEGRHDPAIGHMGGHIQGWVSEDPEADWPIVAKHLAYQVDSYKRYGVEGTDRPTPPPVAVEALRRAPMTAGMAAFMLATPAEAARQIKAYTAGAPVKHVHLWASIAGMPEALVMRHVTTLCSKLRPLLAD
jgi:alkanesulfonate monooxygenase SsuD/methylene tetrahydromethanopterin reductase-like flavin-dependent oxidoreductase (luciferase family)